MDAEEICENLGFTVEEAQEAYDHVQRRMDRIDNWEEKMTSRNIAGDTKLHLHQLVTGDNGDSDWVVTNMHKHAIELTEIDVSGSDIEWFGEKVVTPGDLIMEFEPQYESVDGREIPVWAY